MVGRSTVSLTASIASRMGVSTWRGCCRSPIAVHGSQMGCVACNRQGAVTVQLGIGVGDGLDLAAAVWTGRDVILAGVNASHGRLGVAAYDPAARHWQVITPVLPAGHPPRSVAMVSAAGRLILWS